MRRFTELLEDILWPFGIALAVFASVYVFGRLVLSAWLA